MSPTRHPHILLLPGLHGTDELWSPLLAVMPADIGRTAVRYPTDQILTREQLLCLIEQAAPPQQRLLIIAESFSGPLAVEFAARHTQRIEKLVLCATFVTPPWPSWVCRSIALLLRHFMRPLQAMRACLPDRLADVTVGRAERDALRHVRPQVLASRLRMVADTDCREALRRCSMPIIYLRGSRDFVVRPCCLEKLRQVRPDTQVQVLESSHLILQRCPAQAWAAMSIQQCASL